MSAEFNGANPWPNGLGWSLEDMEAEHFLGAMDAMPEPACFDHEKYQPTIGREPVPPSILLDDEELFGNGMDYRPGCFDDIDNHRHEL